MDDPPRKISGLEFGALSPADILKQSEVEVSSRVLYDVTKGRVPMENGPLDTRLVSIPSVLLTMLTQSLGSVK